MSEPSEMPPTVPLDPKYNNPEKSGLGFTLTGSDMTKDFDLTTAGKGN